MRNVKYFNYYNSELNLKYLCHISSWFSSNISIKMSQNAFPASRVSYVADAYLNVDPYNNLNFGCMSFSAFKHYPQMTPKYSTF